MTCFRLKNGKTVRQYCLENQILYALVYKELEKGLTSEEACRKVLERKGKKAGSEPKYFYKGTPVSKIFKINSTKYHRFISRINNGMSIEKAVEMPKQKAGRKKKNAIHLWQQTGYSNL